MDIRRKYVGIARRVRTSSRPRDPAKGVQNLVAPEEGGLQPDAAFFRGKTQDILLLHTLHVLPPSSGQNVRFHLLNPGRKGDFYVQKNYRYNTQGFIS